MSVSYQGDYTSDLFNVNKRYRLMYQKSVALGDAELREERDQSDSFVRQLIENNFPTGSSTNNGFKIVESSTSNVNNFTIKGGGGTAYDAGVLFVNGYMLFLRNDIEYTNQNSTGTLTDDDYTETSIPALTTPGGPRTDEVYVDFYFAEVGSDGNSEYDDTSLIISGIGSGTANRLRMVQDIRVAEGSTTPSDGVDGNGIYHWYTKIATIVRIPGNNTITNAMITDDRTLINSVQSYSLGTTQTDLLMTDGQNIGDATHGIGTLYMASTVDYSSNLTFVSSGNERVRFRTDGKVGIGTTIPTNQVEIQSTSGEQLKISRLDTATSTEYVGIRFGNAHLSKLHVV